MCQLPHRNNTNNQWSSELPAPAQNAKNKPINVVEVDGHLKKFDLDGKFDVGVIPWCVYLIHLFYVL
jgi:hypothetical protein